MGELPNMGCKGRVGDCEDDIVQAIRAVSGPLITLRCELDTPSGAAASRFESMRKYPISYMRHGGDRLIGLAFYLVNKSGFTRSLLLMQLTLTPRST